MTNYLPQFAVITFHLVDDFISVYVCLTAVAGGREFTDVYRADTSWQPQSWHQDGESPVTGGVQVIHFLTFSGDYQLTVMRCL